MSFVLPKCPEHNITLILVTDSSELQCLACVNKVSSDKIKLGTYNGAHRSKQVEELKSARKKLMVFPKQKWLSYQEYINKYKPEQEEFQENLHLLYEYNINLDLCRSLRKEYLIWVNKQKTILELKVNRNQNDN